MQRLASTQQILCVTHQAAIAARADAHFLVRKSFNEDRTCATVERLDDEQRTSELSRMLAGGRALTASRTLARRLLEAAHRAA
jgi:DNA repair protein RecN (Recombination protein N)